MSTKAEKDREGEAAEEDRPQLSAEEAEEHERQRYSRGDFSDMYYPQYYEPFLSSSKRNRVITREAPNCVVCGEASPNTLRLEPGDRYHCVNCLKKMGVSIMDGTKKSFPVEVIMNIALCLDDYRDLCSCARVSTTWFEAINYDSCAENEMTKMKRYLIGREIYIQYDRTKHKNPAVEAFEARFELGRIIGEWDVASVERRLSLCRLVHDSNYYCKPLGLRKSSGKAGSEYGKYIKDDDTFVVSADFVVKGPSHHRDGHYTIQTKAAEGDKVVVLTVDKGTGMVLEASSAPGKDKKCAIM